MKRNGVGAAQRDEESDGREDRWRLGAQSVVAGVRREKAILLDSGSDEHVCEKDFGEGAPRVSGDPDGGSLTDNQGRPMPISDTRRVEFLLPEVDGGVVVSEAQFKL